MVGEGAGLERPERTSKGVEAPDLSALLYWMILRMFLGSLLDVMTVVTPAAVAISAAMSLVSIPPVPRLDPSVVVLTIQLFPLASEDGQGQDTTHLVVE